MSGFEIVDPPPGCTCGPYWSVVPPGPCPHHSPQFRSPAYFAPLPPRLSDEDVDRIARRVYDLMRPDRCRLACPHGDRCTLAAGHPDGCNHRGCDCNEPNVAVTT